MDKIFHRTAPIIALHYMPEGFQEFLICKEFTAKDISDIATYPDLLDHDNLRQNAEIHHAHSYKLDAAGKWIDGDCIKTLEGLCAFTLNAMKEYGITNQWPLAWLTRYALAKLTHYRIDCLTYPHLHHGKPWSEHHASFEKHMDAWINGHAWDLGDFKFEPYTHVYKECRKTALDAWKRGEELVERLEAGEKMTEEDCAIAARACVQGVGDLWLTLALQMGLSGAAPLIALHYMPEGFSEE